MLFSADHVLVQVWGVVGDSASNNNTAIAELTKKGYARIDGPRCQIRCFAHILNLVSQVSLFPLPPVLVDRVESGLTCLSKGRTSTVQQAPEVEAGQ
jgi:hypothetical protein